MYRVRGFTLLELLVVMVLMGLLSAAAMTTVNYAFTDDTAEKHSERMAALVELAAEEALLTGRELGMRIDDDGYSFYRFEERQQAWRRIDEQKIFRSRTFPEHIETSLHLEGQQVVLEGNDDEQDATSETATDRSGKESGSENGGKNGRKKDSENGSKGDSDSSESGEQDGGGFAEDPPQVMFFSSGQSTPFELEILDTRDDKRWRLEADLLGRVEREQVK